MRTGGDKQNNGEGTFAVGKSCAVVFGIKIKLLCTVSDTNFGYLIERAY